MARDVQISVTVDDAQAIRAWQRSRDSIEEYVASSRKIGPASRQNQQESSSFLQSTGKGLATVAAGFVGIGSALQAVNLASRLMFAEYDNLLQAQQKSAQANLSIGQLDAELITNSKGAEELGATPGERSDAIRALRSRIADDLQLTERQVSPILSQAVSSRGDLGIDKAAQAASLALALSPNDVSGAQARTSLTLGLASGGVDVKSAAGFGLAAQEVLPIAQTEAAAQALGKTIPGARAFGVTAPEAAGLFGAFALSTNDTRGDQTATFLPKALGFIDKLAPNIERLGDQIDFIQDNQQQFDLSLEKLPGEERFRPLFQQLLKGTGQGLDVERQFIAARDSLPTLQQSGRVVDDTLEAFQASPSLRLLNLEQFFDRQIEKGQLEDIEGAKAGVIRDKLPDYLQSRGFGALDQDLVLKEFDARVLLGDQNPLNAVSEGLERRADALAGPTLQSAAAGFIADPLAPEQRFKAGLLLNPVTGPLLGVTPEKKPATAENIERSNDLKELTQAIREFIRQQEQRERTAEARQQPQPVVQVQVNNRKSDGRLPPGPRPLNVLSEAS